jgi:hypothetical protein
MPYSKPENLRDILRILPATTAAEVRDAWSIGEQESALALAIGALVERAAAMSEVDRARLAALAERWSTLEAISPALNAVAR